MYFQALIHRQNHDMLILKIIINTMYIDTFTTTLYTLSVIVDVVWKFK